MEKERRLVVSIDWPDTLPGCFIYYGRPEWPNGPCKKCAVKKLCKASAERERTEKWRESLKLQNAILKRALMLLP